MKYRLEKPIGHRFRDSSTLKEYPRADRQLIFRRTAIYTYLEVWSIVRAFEEIWQALIIAKTLPLSSLGAFIS